MNILLKWVCAHCLFPLFNYRPVGVFFCFDRLKLAFKYVLIYCCDGYNGHNSRYKRGVTLKLLFDWSIVRQIVRLIDWLIELCSMIWLIDWLSHQRFPNENGNSVQNAKRVSIISEWPRYGHMERRKECRTTSFSHNFRVCELNFLFRKMWSQFCEKWTREKQKSRNCWVKLNRHNRPWALCGAWQEFLYYSIG